MPRRSFFLIALVLSVTFPLRGQTLDLSDPVQNESLRCIGGCGVPTPGIELSSLPNGTYPGRTVILRLTLSHVSVIDTVEFRIPRESRFLITNCQGGTFDGIDRVRCTSGVSTPLIPNISIDVGIAAPMKTGNYASEAKAFRLGREIHSSTTTTIVIDEFPLSRPRTRAARRQGQYFPAVNHILWIAAHPDDEILISPLLGSICIDQGKRCKFLIATRGEKGECLLPGGCYPDLATVRTREMESAAAFFNAQLTLWDLPDASGDSPESVMEAWSSRVGSRTMLIQGLATAIFQSGAHEVVILDPRHGGTCHADHRAISTLVLEAVQSLGANGPVEVFLAETLVQPDQLAGVVRFRPAVPSDPETVAFNANASRPNGRSVWEFTALDVALHPSQFDSSTVLALENTPFSDRVLHFIRLSEADLADPRYAEFCR